MKLTIERIAILVLGIIIVVFIMRGCADSGEEKEEKLKEAYNSTIAELKGRMAHVNELQEHAIKSLADHSVKDSIERTAFKIENTRLKKQLATRRPQVQVMIDSTPPLKAFIQTQDSIILTQDVRIDSLEASLEFHRMVNQDLITNEFVEDKIEQQMAIEQTQRIEELEKLSRRKERKSRLAKVLIPIIGVAGLLVGASL